MVVDCGPCAHAQLSLALSKQQPTAKNEREFFNLFNVVVGPEEKMVRETASIVARYHIVMHTKPRTHTHTSSQPSIHPYIMKKKKILFQLPKEEKSSHCSLK